MAQDVVLTEPPALPISGRQQELEKLLSILGESIGSSGGLVLISGESGIGKSRLTEEVIRIAEGSRCTVFLGRCVPGIPCPYLPFKEAFGRARGQVGHNCASKADATGLAAPWLEVIDNMDPFQDRPTAEVSGERDSDTDRVLFRSLDLLVRMSELGPVVLVLEDLHWADTATVQLLHFLARNVGSLRVMMLGTYRPEDLVTTDGLPHPLTEAIQTMRREETLLEVPLSRMRDAEITLMVERTLNGRLDPALAQRIVGESEGNPLYAMETIRLMTERGHISFKDSMVQMTAGNDYKTQGTVRDVILRRLERLPVDDRRLLDCASVMGDCFEPEVIARVMGVEKRCLLDRLRHLERTFHLISVGPDLCRFEHEKLRTVCYEEISSLRRRELHRIMGEVIEGQGPNENDAGRLSTHFYYGRVSSKCLKYSKMAGDGCLSKFAAREARLYYSRALEVTKGENVDPALNSHIVEGLGDSELELTDHGSAYGRYEELLAVSTDPKMKVRLLRKSCDCWMPQRLGKGDRTMHRMLLDKALSYPQIEPLERAELLSMMAIEHAWDGALIEALTVLDEALSLFKASGALEKLTWEKGNRGILLMSASRIDEAIVDLEDAKETLADDPWPRCEVHVNMCLGEAYIHKGDLEKAWSALERSRELTAILGNYYQLSWVHYYRAMIRTFEGDLGSSMEEARMSRSYAQKYDYPFMVTMPNFLLVHLMSRTGDIKEAVSLCQETADILSGPRLDTHSPIYALAHLGRAELFSAMDDKDRAGREYQKALKELVSVQYSPFYTAITRTWYGQTLLSEGAVDEAFGNLHLAKRFFESVGNELFSSRIAEMMESYASH